MSRNFLSTFISEKVSKIRWAPSFSHNRFSFVTASWDDNVNNIRLWEVTRHFKNNQDPDANLNDLYPYEITQLPLKGDITELKFIGDGFDFVASTSLGNVYHFRIDIDEKEEIAINEIRSWKSLHKTSNGFGTASCNSFALYDNDIASVGSDGCVNLLSTDQDGPKHVIKNADSCSLSCVEFLRFDEIVTCNKRGLFKLWDLRSDSGRPESTFTIRSDCIVAATCLTHHPVNRHIIAAGDEFGGLTVWDLRQNTYPLNTYSSHSGCVNEVIFHHDIDQQIFSCSNNGDVFHWNGPASHEAFYLSTAGTSKYEVFRLMADLHLPINSIDVLDDKLLCGGDNEAMYLIENVNIYEANDLGWN